MKKQLSLMLFISGTSFAGGHIGTIGDVIPGISEDGHYLGDRFGGGLDRLPIPLDDYRRLKMRLELSDSVLLPKFPGIQVEQQDEAIWTIEEEPRVVVPAATTEQE